MAQYFNLTLDTKAPLDGSISVLPYYKDNTVPITMVPDEIDPTDPEKGSDVKFMKVWITQEANGSKEDEGYTGGTWLPFSTQWLPNFSVEGTNYIHAVYMDAVGNQGEVINSTNTFYDHTVPVVEEVKIAGGEDIITDRNTTVRVSFDDGDGSGVASVTISGDLADGSQTSFTCSYTDRENGYIDCAIVLKEITGGSDRATETVYAQATDRAGNVSAQGSDTVIVYSGGVDPLIVLRDNTTNAVLGNHYNVQRFKLNLEVKTGLSSMIEGYKVFGDFTNNPTSSTATPEPTDWTVWTSEATVITVPDTYFTKVDGNHAIKGKVKLTIGTLTGTVATKAELPSSGVSDGAIYMVQADETKEDKADFYRYSATGNKFNFYGMREGTAENYAVNDLTSATIHFSESAPEILLTSDVTTISDKTGFDVAELTALFETTSCPIKEYKIVGYKTQALAEAGTEADLQISGMYGNEEKAMGESWEVELSESALITAVPDEGAKYLVCYAKNLCGNWGKSNIASITIDLTPPQGSISVDAYYKEPKGFVASSTSGDVAKMQVWVDSNPLTATPPITSAEYEYAPLTVEDSSKVDWTNKVEGTCYAHIKYTDAVGNSAVYHSNSFIFDSVAPTQGSVSTVPVSTSTTITLTISSTDLTSGVAKMKITGDVEDGATVGTWVDYATSATVTLKMPDGYKTINVVFKDHAGNETVTPATCTTRLDTQHENPTLVLWNATNTAELPTVISTSGFVARIGTTGELEGVADYKIYGDVGGTSTPVPETDATWKTFTPDAGKEYMSVWNQSFTTGDGTKTVKIKTRDSLGRESQEVTAVKVMLTTPPNVNVSGMDASVVSKLHEPRLDETSGAIVAEKYTDMMTFKFATTNLKFVEWKVCVNETGQTAESAVPIGTTHGSQNMSGLTGDPGTTGEAGDPIECTIMALDFAETAQVEDTDGVYEVIVYVKGESGVWSAVHVI